MNEFDQDVEGVELPDIDLDAGDGFDAGGGSGKGGGTAVFAIILVVVLAVQAVSSHFILRATVFSKPPKTKAKEKTEKVEYGEIFQLDGLIVNPTDSRGSKHLLVDIGLQTTNAAIITELGEKELLLRDNINTFLSAQKLEVLTDIHMRQKIRERLKEIVDYNLEEGQVDKVYFIRYVLQ
jgi:flagellar basal body-associated protein FliL